MRMLISIFVMMAALAFVTVSPVEAQGLTIALSPHVTEEERQEQGETVLRFLATHIEPGHSAEIINAYDLAPIATFTVPEGRAYQNPRAKLAVNRQAAAMVLRLQPSGQREANDVQRPINLPGLLRYLSETHRLSGEHDLIIIGSPIYDMPREPQVSMREGRVPGDGLIRGTRGSSPFGADGMGDRLAGTRVHMATLDPGWALNDRHAFAVERFTSLLVEAYGAQLVNFANDAESVFAGVAGRVQAQDRGFVLEDTDKLEMLVFAADLGPVATGRDVGSGQRFYSGSALTQGRVEIGLYWPCTTCDLDLHVRPGPDAVPVSYLRNSTAEGHFFKSFRMGEQDRRAQETIILDGPVDLNALRIWVNFYGGRSPGGAEAELRIAIGGETYLRTLRVPAGSGNGGAGREAVIETGREDSAWVSIAPLALLRE